MRRFSRANAFCHSWHKWSIRLACLRASLHELDAAADRLRFRRDRRALGVAGAALAATLIAGVSYLYRLTVRPIDVWRSEGSQAGRFATAAEPGSRHCGADAALGGKGEALTRALRNIGLSVIVLVMFALSLLGQRLIGERVYNADRRDHGQPTVTFPTYLLTGHFVEAIFENWEGEFLGVFLRERGSPESKPVAAAHGAAGNE